MDKKLYFIVALMFFLVLPFSSSTSMPNLPNPQIKNNCINLPQSCSNCSYIKLTIIQLPDLTLINISSNMQSLGNNFYNYTFCNVSQNGQYLVNTFSDDAVPNAQYTFLANLTGTDVNITTGIIYFIFLLSAVGLFLLTLYGAIKIPTKNKRGQEGNIVSINKLKYVKVLLFAFSYLFLMMITGILTSITRNLLSFDSASNFFEIIYWSMLSALFPIMIIGLILVIMWAVHDRKLSKKLQRGIRIL